MSKRLALTALGAALALSAMSLAPSAAPLSAATSKAVSAASESVVSDVHWRRWHHCHRRLVCKHGWCKWKKWCHGGKHRHHHKHY